MVLKGLFPGRGNSKGGGEREGPGGPFSYLNREKGVRNSKKSLAQRWNLSGCGPHTPHQSKS